MKDIFGYFRASFFHLEKIWSGRKIAFWKTSIYFCILAIISSVPIAIRLWGETNHLLKEVKAVGKKLPDFTIENGKLDSLSEGFVYESDQFIFTFDPEDKWKDKTEDLEGTEVPSISFLKHFFVIRIPSANGKASGGEQFQPNYIRYDKESFENVTGVKLRSVLERMSSPAWVFGIFLMISIIPAVFGLLFYTLILALGGWMYLKMVGISVRFVESWKLVLLTSASPIVLTSLLVLFLPDLNQKTIWVFTTLFLFFKVVEVPRFEKRSNHQ
ncbi:MAG: DUF1189 domain-containing protein [Streptococcaceae bacterium]|nr:DUF1189 domain-containing protein [Streptococcaceae bacterium]